MGFDFILKLRENHVKVLQPWIREGLSLEFPVSFNYEH